MRASFGLSQSIFFDAPSLRRKQSGDLSKPLFFLNFSFPKFKKFRQPPLLQKSTKCCIFAKENRNRNRDKMSSLVIGIPLLIFLSLKDILATTKISFFLSIYFYSIFFFLGNSLFVILYTSISLYFGSLFKSNIIVLDSKSRPNSSKRCLVFT